MSNHSYPSPPSQQANTAHGAPYYGTTSSEPPQVPQDLKQLQNAEDPRSEAALRESLLASAASGGPAYATHPDYADDDQQRTTSPERLAQGVLNASNEEEYREGQPSRKRSKVSRACDECRRKKVSVGRLWQDISRGTLGPYYGTSQADIIQIRTPMKRGPSKGYIRELADRLQHLENQVGPSTPQEAQHDMQYPPSYGGSAQALRYGEGQHPYMSSRPQESRKRTRSISEGRETIRDPNLTRQGGSWATGALNSQMPAQETPNQPHPPHYDTAYESAAAHRHDLSPSSRRGPGRPDHYNASRDSLAPPQEADVSAAEVRHIEWDEPIVDEYYRTVHQTLPFLPHSKQRLYAFLGRASHSLQRAFVIALNCAIRSSGASAMPATSKLASDIQDVSELISHASFETSHGHDMSAYILHIQVLILLVLATGASCPESARGPPPAEWLGRAIGMATHKRLNLFDPHSHLAEANQDENRDLGRRVWWVLFILDRWHASSTSNILQIPDNGSSLLAEDRVLLGESAYHLTRLSFIIGHLSMALQQGGSLVSVNSPAASVITLTLVGEIDRFRESVESLLLGDPSLILLSFMHTRLLVLRLTASTKPHEFLEPATNIAKMLASRNIGYNPLNHHCAALAAITLAELLSFEETRQEAEQNLDLILETLTKAENDTSWDSIIREFVVARRTHSSKNRTDRTEAVGLQHLADAATISGEAAAGIDKKASEGGNPRAAGMSLAETGFDSAFVTRYGYLAALTKDPHNVYQD
ncbi:MAG: Glucose-responsive transcription factor [Chrysothrix sp. TS-e1954]|nr:MAG: Glucose-responsive transcription factor [Chrysothrix sp. TS-e1954]